MKTFEQQQYPYILTVRVETTCLGEPLVWNDQIKGLNRGHALYLGRRNWEGSTVIPLAKENK